MSEIKSKHVCVDNRTFTVEQLPDGSKYVVALSVQVLDQPTLTTCLTPEQAHELGAALLAFGEKTFDAVEAQRRATALRHALVGKRHRHRKGGIYRVMWVDVDEATGEPRVSYRSAQLGFVWNRTLVNFVEVVDGKPRFEQLDDNPNRHATCAGGCGATQEELRTVGHRGDCVLAPPDEMRAEYNIRGGERGKYAERYNKFHTVKLIGTSSDARCAGGCGATVGELLTTGHRPGCRLSTDTDAT